jgi:phosphoglycerate dehydrogenase-like enzyme
VSRGPVTCVVVGAAPSSVPSGALEAVAGAVLSPLAAATPEQLAAAEAAFVWDFRWRGLEDLLARSRRLGWVHAGSAGVDHLLPALASRPDIVLTNSAGVFERPIAEYVLGLMLAHAKGFDETARAQSERRWAYRETASLDGATLVVVGAGRIGTAIARLAAAMDMHVIGVRRTAPDGAPPPMFARMVGIADLVTVVGEADFVAIATPATPATDRLVDARVLAAMKPTAFLMNVGRATAVDTAALTVALRDMVIAGAALDVFDEEPLPPDSPLWAVPNLLISPHMSGDAGGWGARIIELFAANLAAWREGLPLEAVVDRSRGY